MNSEDQICVSVFQDGTNRTDKETYTAVWAALLKQMNEMPRDLAKKETGA